MNVEDKIAEIKQRSDLSNPRPWGEHDLALEVDWYKRDAIPFLLKQYEDVLEFACKQAKDIHDLGCEIDGLKMQLPK